MTHIHRHSFISISWFIYTLLIIYGTLYPIDRWDWSLGNWDSFLSLQLPQTFSYADLVINFIIYIPFGFFLFHLLDLQYNKIGKILLVSFAGFTLCTSLEFLQQFLPGRTSSLSDIILNTISSTFGALFALLFSQNAIQSKLKYWFKEHLSHYPYSSLGLAAACLWGASQLVPFVPSLDIGNLHHGLAPFWHTINSPDSLIVSKLTINSLNISAIFLILRAALKKNTLTTQLIILFILGILLLKIPIVSRQLSLEASIGFFIGLLIYSALYRLNVRIIKITALILLLLAYGYESLLPGDINLTTRPMNWIPFSQQMNTLVGIADLIEQIGLFAALAFLLSPKTLKPQKRYLLFTGGFIFLFAFTFEWLQQFIPGRYSDITDVIIAFSSWVACMLYPWNSHTPLNLSTKKQTNPTFSFKFPYLIIPLIVISLIISLSFIIRNPVTTAYSYKLPEISELPDVALPNFKQEHPRLPAPSLKDISLLESQNKSFFKQHKRMAKKGNLYSQTLIAYVYPGTIDLAKLFNKIMKLEPSWRGHKQTKPIALAYDWLYMQWSPEQQNQLRTKLREACDYQIYAIRDKYELSPYNVYLYNSPFQALIAASLALHKDIPKAEDNCMRFTHDYWTNRVAPVWQQVMGKNGGWHEGGEYIGIGIGQAIYQVPAMWLNATGEDYFSQLPGIAGFLDFLVYRTRPDGTHFRWGDASFFDRRVPDRIPLAIEFQHKAAYNLKKPATKLQPTSWPWGSLNNNNLIHDKASHQLPLTKLFDGISLVFSRTSWDKDATYVTFKAGDNFWSHTHLDQGAFTIFKGGALAIDSGLYGSKYGADHHMNYTYQSIAHNVVTITDPNDTLPIPPKKKKDQQKQKKQQPRKIANDGGQRKVGSGWGKRAPLDLQDWLNQSDIYHTATIEKIIEKNNIVAVSADLTPAYTNSLSGKETFAHRTKRVKSYQRIFIHDKNNDLIIIFDQIKTFNPNFRKKWLLHSLHEPTIDEQFFHLSTPPNTKLNMSGGKLKGQVLLPQKHLIQKIGGKGFEYYVDGKNYDDNGKVLKKINQLKNIEAGKWRIELQPQTTNKEDIFLVALQPTLFNENKPFPDIQVSRDKNRIICRINGQPPFIFHLNDNNNQVTVDF